MSKHLKFYVESLSTSLYQLYSQPNFRIFIYIYRHTNGPKPKPKRTTIINKILWINKDKRRVFQLYTTIVNPRLDNIYTFNVLCNIRRNDFRIFNWPVWFVAEILIYMTANLAANFLVYFKLKFKWNEDTFYVFQK